MNKKLFLAVSFVTCFGLQVEASNQSWFDDVCTPGDETSVNIISFLDSAMLTIGLAAVTIIAMKACDLGEVVMSFVEDPEHGFDRLSGLPGDK